MNDKLKDIISNIKNQNDNSKELINALETLEVILQKFYHLQMNIIDIDKSLSIESILSSIESLNSKTTDSLGVIIKLSDDITRITEDLEKKSTANINRITKQSDEINNIIEVYNVLDEKSNELSRLCTKVGLDINKIKSNLTNKVEVKMENLITTSEKILSEINMIDNVLDKKIDLLDKKIMRFEEINNDIDKKLKNLENMLIDNNQQKSLVVIKDNIEDIMILTEYINDAIEKRSLKNGKEIDGFEYLANKWADQNIRGLAIRKKK